VNINAKIIVAIFFVSEMENLQNRGDTGMATKKNLNSLTVKNVIIKGEGLDEFGKRYFKFSVRNSDKDIPPIAAEQLWNNPAMLWAALTNAGWNGFTRPFRKA
jgi:hypothetical protein